MSVYASLLQQALAADTRSGGSVTDLVSRALSRRALLGRPGDSAMRISDSLAYDVALVRLCERLGIEHDLDGKGAPARARSDAEHELAARLPSLADALGLDRGDKKE